MYEAQRKRVLVTAVTNLYLGPRAVSPVLLRAWLDAMIVGEYGLVDLPVVMDQLRADDRSERQAIAADRFESGSAKSEAKRRVLAREQLLAELGQAVSPARAV